MAGKKLKKVAASVAILIAAAAILTFGDTRENPENGLSVPENASDTKAAGFETIKDLKPVSEFIESHEEYNFSSVSDGTYENITLSSGDEEIFLMIGGGGSGGGSSATSGESSAGIPSEPCIYSYYVTGSDMQLWHINEGCSNPNPVCDPEGFCRRCSSNGECIRKVETIAIPIGNMTFEEVKITGYNIVDTSSGARFNEIYETCEMIFMEETQSSYEGLSESECLEKLLSFATCTEGQCDSTM